MMLVIRRIIWVRHLLIRLLPDVRIQLVFQDCI